MGEKKFMAILGIDTQEKMNQVKSILGDAMGELCTYEPTFSIVSANSDGFYLNWAKQKKEPNYKNCTEITYEDFVKTEPLNNYTLDNLKAQTPTDTETINCMDTNQKENKMENTTQITVNIDGKDICNSSTKKAKKVVVKTALQRAKKYKYTGTIFKEDGGYHTTIIAKSEKKLINMFKSSKYRDMVMVISVYTNTIQEERRFTKTK